VISLGRADETLIAVKRDDGRPLLQWVRQPTPLPVMLFTVVGSGFVALGLAIGWYGIRPLAVVLSVLRATVRDP